MDGSSVASTKDTAGESSDTASTSYQPFPEMSAEQEFFLYELETTDSGSIGLVLRAIYDCGDVRKFSRALEHRIHQYDRNIQKVCSFHYQGFVDSMKELLLLKERCSDIKHDAAAIDSQIQAASEDLSRKSEEIVKYRKLVKNASTAIDQISVCLPVLENYAKLQELMQLKKYYQALKVLEELEHTHLALVEKYRFTQILAKTMSPVRNEIKAKAYSEFKDFLENVKKVACRIGRHASRCTAEQHSFGVSEAERARKLQQEAKQKFVDVEIAVSADGRLLKKNTSNGSAPVHTSDSLEDDEKVSAQDLIDFTPVHRCCQIFNVLGAKEEFDVYYRQQRKDQCDLVIEPPSKMNSLKHYVDYLDEIIGFFVVEDHIIITEPTLVTSSHKDQLWESALKKIVHTMNSRFGGCPDVEMMLRMKKVILLFALTMKSYGYGIAPLYSLLQNFRDQYNEILMSEYCAQFERDLEKDNYAPISVENEEQFRAVIKEFPFYKRSMEQEPFPRKFPYSRFVVSAYSKAKLYLQGCLKFMEHLQLTHSEMDDTVRRYANVLLSRWSGSLKSFVERKLSLVQLVQITINIGYLEKSCESLGVYITKITSGNELNVSMTAHQLSLTERVFRDARSEVEQQIEMCIRDKVDAFIELAQYDWELPASSGHASDYISDLINYLSTTFLSFTNLPSVLARHVCMQTCKHLSSRLSDVLLSPDVRAISMGALEQFSLDVMQCEMFTARCPVAGFDHNTLPMTFAHLRQLLELVMSNDWTSYLAEYGQENGTYVRVNAATATQLLEKMIEFEKKSSGFFGINKGDRKKLLDTIIRQLRALSAQ
uniref:Exocyst complex component n=1 Tax=Haemonchus contortus TaxID=6289 RepID=A0A7I5E723_HAECO|nr:Exocyst complex subunit Sec15 domain containing protein [Haemonchus contortus]CDJ96443.1 Exocyst complex subunit Sec15 domain containing protein [Haemonchus contortus]